MKKYIYTLLIVIISLLSACKTDEQVTSGSIEFKAKWNKGDLYKFRISRVIKEWEDTSVIKDFTSEFTAEFRVLEKTDTSYKISWSFDPNSLLYLFPSANRNKLNSVIPPSIIYETSEYGEYKSLVNADELGKYVSKMFEVLLQKPEKESAADSLWREGLKGYRELYASKEGIESSAIGEVLAFHDVFRGKLILHEPVEITNKVVNPISGSLVRQYGTTELTGLDTLDKKCNITVKSEIDSSDMAKAMGELFDNTTNNLSPDEAKLYRTMLIQNLHFRQTESQKFQFRYDPGLPLYFELYKNTDYNLGSTHKAAEEKMVIELAE